MSVLCWNFPLRFRPPSWRYKDSRGGRAFDSPRPDSERGSRRHAGCDLMAPVGSDVLAVDYGVVLRVHRNKFPCGTDSIEIRHMLFVAHYCEIRAAKGVQVGTPVEPGQVIAKVAKMGQTMLHFELYRGTDAGNIFSNRPPHYRRKDLMDPTRLLDLFALSLAGGK